MKVHDNNEKGDNRRNVMRLATMTFEVRTMNTCKSEILATLLDESWTHYFQLGLNKIFRNVFWTRQNK